MGDRRPSWVNPGSAGKITWPISGWTSWLDRLVLPLGRAGASPGRASRAPAAGQVEVGGAGP
eukprot:10113872-Alexandrium_andersonii.AAC.1